MDDNKEIRVTAYVLPDKVIQDTRDSWPFMHGANLDQMISPAAKDTHFGEDFQSSLISKVEKDTALS